jgi:hypothetical protein
MVKIEAYRRLLITEAAHTPEFEKDELPTNNAQYAEVQVQMPGGTKEDLYEFTDKLKENQALAGKGGIQDSTGDFGSNFIAPEVSDPQPNAQKSLNGCAIRAALRLLSSRLGTEDDPLTHDQENYGSGSTLSAQTFDLYDPETCSNYARENNVNNNTTENPLLSSNTVDQPEPADGYAMQGEEGLLTSKSTNDGDFDPAGRATGDRLITEDPRNHGYLNVHQASADDSLLEALVDQEIENGEPAAWQTPDSPELMGEGQGDGEEVDADADPRLWNLANQPMGQAG